MHLTRAPLPALRPTLVAFVLGFTIGFAPVRADDRADQLQTAEAAFEALPPPAPPVPVAAADPAPPVPSADQEAPSGLTVPALKIPGRLTVDYLDQGKSVGDYVKDTLSNPKTFTKIGAVLLLSPLTARLAMAMPGPPLLKTAVGLSGAFLGWELGRLDLGAVDWTGTLAEIGAASGAYLLTQRLMGVSGIMTGGWTAAAVSVGAAILTHVLLEKLRGHEGPTHASADEVEDPGPVPEGGVVSGGLDLPPVDLGAGAVDGVPSVVDELGGLKAAWLSSVEAFQHAPSAANLRSMRMAEAAYKGQLGP